MHFSTLMFQSVNRKAIEQLFGWCCHQNTFWFFKLCNRAGTALITRTSSLSLDDRMVIGLHSLSTVYKIRDDACQ